MGDDSVRQDDLPLRSLVTERSRGSGVVFALVVLALILAIGFFYLTNDKRTERADVVMHAADSVDDAARVVGRAAQDAANDLRPHDKGRP